MIRNFCCRYAICFVSASAIVVVTSTVPANDDPLDTATAVAVRGTPVVDGEVDLSWQAAPMIQVNKPVPNMAASEADDLAHATVRLQWDDEHLYALVEVTDVAAYGNSPDPWQQDSVELFLDESYARSTSFQPDDSHYRINFEGTVTGGQNYDPASFRSATRKTSTGYRIECALKIRTRKLTDGTKLGFECQVNDNRDGGSRAGITKWAAADNESWNNTSRFGTLTCLTMADAVPADTTAGPVTATTSSRAGHAKKQEAAEDQASIERRMPEWAADAVFYQIFPERFRNGDPDNDPTIESLEFPDIMPANWEITPWTSDWYARADWEKEMGDDFFEPAVFHRRYGGDLQGVLDKLDYLKQLGINTIYLNPVFYARSLHKYDGNSYHHVDPHFGPDPAGDFALMEKETSDPATWNWTKADLLFLEVVKQAHQRGIRLIVDGVFNHTGRDFFAFDDLVKNKQKSPYVDWYVVHEFDDPETEANEFKYQCWWGVDTLPEFANNEDGSDLHKGPKEYIFDATRRWMDPNGDGDPADGIDGWRLDVANEVPDDFWVDWNQLVRELNPEAYTVSEIWEGASDYLRRCGFSASMNYHAFAFVTKGFLIDGRSNANRFVSDVQSRRTEHPWRVQLGMQNLFDSHDTERVASMIVNAPKRRSYLKPDRYDYDIQERASLRHWDEYEVRKPNADERRIQKLATLFQMSYVGAPMLYYGSEAGMWGGDDPCDRKPMVWADLAYDAEQQDPRGRQRPVDEVKFDEELYDFHRQMVQMRAGSDALRRGKVLAMTGFDTSKCVAMLRQEGCQWALVAINRSEEEQSIRLPAVDFPAPPETATLFTTDQQQPPQISSEFQHVAITLPRLSASCWTWSIE